MGIAGHRPAWGTFSEKLPSESETEISLPVSDVLQMLYNKLADLFVGDVHKLTENKVCTDNLGVKGGVIHKIFLKSHKRVWVTAVVYLLGLAQIHETVACSALSVARRAEAGDVTHSHKPVNNLIKGSVIGNVELLGVFILV